MVCHAWHVPHSIFGAVVCTTVLAYFLLPLAVYSRATLDTGLSIDDILAGKSGPDLESPDDILASFGIGAPPAVKPAAATSPRGPVPTPAGRAATAPGPGAAGAGRGSPAPAPAGRGAPA